MDQNNKNASRLIAFRASPEAQRQLARIKKERGLNTTEALHFAIELAAEQVAA